MKIFKLIFILIGIILLCAVIIFKISDGLPERDKQVYNSALQLTEQVNTLVWKEFNFKEYPTAIRYKDTEYVFYYNRITERKPVLQVAANTARLVDGKANIFVLNINDMEVLKEFSEGLGNSDYLLGKFSLRNKSMSDAEYIAILYHEGFHAYQIQKYGDVFVSRIDSLVKKYGFEDFFGIINRKDVYEQYKPEAFILYKVFETNDNDALKLLAQQYLDARKTRHVKLKELLAKEDYIMMEDFEQYYEKLEGIASYIMLKISELLGREDIFNEYKDSIIEDFSGTKKFYNSGAGMCYLLDKLGVPWKQDVFSNNLSLEQLIQKSLEGTY